MAQPNVKIEGMIELDRAFKRLAQRLGPDVAEPILLEGAQIITDEVQSNVNQINAVTGRLRRSPVTKLVGERRGNNPRPAISAIDRKVAPHAFLVETGIGKGPAQPYFRPAWDTKRGEAESHVLGRLKKAAEEVGR